jgi:predicted dehydrogenase
MGMVGGGHGALIGRVHRLAAELDGAIELVCGAFASDPERSRNAGAELYGLAMERCYPDWPTMLVREAALPAATRMQFVTIATPNHLHFPIAQAALAAGFPVVCDKPLCLDLDEAQSLTEQVQAGSPWLAVTYNYTGYPMIREARELVAAGAIGPVRRVVCEYLQGWLTADISGNKQADWRTDPARAGAAGCFGDIGSHCENLVSFVTGLSIQAVCADLSRFVPGRRLDDDGNVLLRFAQGARGVIMASQVAVGEENGLSLRVYGERAGLSWHQQEPNTLRITRAEGPVELRRTGGPGLSEAARAAARLPAGHPEGYLEAFANLYRDVAARLNGATASALPDVADGARGMRFLHRVVESSQAGGRWVSLG